MNRGGSAPSKTRDHEGSPLPRILIIIPTRNRADLVDRAARSVLQERIANVEVVISDNSSDSVANNQVDAIVTDIGDARLSVQRPPKAMSMTDHWDWALRRATQMPSISHVVILTDRMLFKEHGVSDLYSIVARHQSQIISYNHDRIVDLRMPISIELQPWSDMLLAVDSRALLALSAKCSFPQALPRLLNCATPVAVLKSVEEKFGSIVASVSPDYNFCYRALGLVPEVLYWDRAPIFHYALGRSNGESTARGVETRDNEDFRKLNSIVVCSRAPAAGVRTLSNAMIHEYVVASEEMPSVAFPEVDLPIYAKELERELSMMENQALAATMIEQISVFRERNGLGPSTINLQKAPQSRIREAIRRIGIGRRMLLLRQHVQTLLRPLLRDGPPQPRDVARALAFARKHDGAEVQGVSHLSFLNATIVEDANTPSYL